MDRIKTKCSCKKGPVDAAGSVDSELIGGEDKQIQSMQHALHRDAVSQRVRNLFIAESLTEKHSQPTIVTGYQLEKWPMAI